ncbi:MAG TPA: hypothetical protein VGF45_15415 [Polyangia bacterium]
MSGGYEIQGCDGRIVSLRGGQLATMETADGAGFVRRPAPEDGLLLDLKSESIFIPAANMRAALRGTAVKTERVELQPARRGDSVVLERNGGFSQKVLDRSGILIGTKRSTFMLPTRAAKELLAELDPPRSPTRRPPSKVADVLER